MEFLLLPVYIRLKHRHRSLRLKIALKGCMTLIPVVFCSFAFINLHETTGTWSGTVEETGFTTSVLILAGLIICFTADLVLEISFPLGMILFMCGHICYILYFFTIGGFNPLFLLIFSVSIFFTYSFFSRFKEAMGKIWPAYYLYACTINVTASVGLLLPLSIGAYGVLPAISACLLVISDYMLASNRLSGKRNWSDLLYLSYYFTGQYFLSLSVYIPVMLKL